MCRGCTRGWRDGGLVKRHRGFVWERANLPRSRRTGSGTARGGHRACCLRPQGRETPAPRGGIAIRSQIPHPPSVPRLPEQLRSSWAIRETRCQHGLCVTSQQYAVHPKRHYSRHCAYLQQCCEVRCHFSRKRWHGPRRRNLACPSECLDGFLGL